MIRPPKIDKKYVEAVIANYIRKHTNAKHAHFFPTKDLFDKIGLDYDNKNHYRLVMDVIHSWRRQAGFFWHTLIEEGRINHNGRYTEGNFDAFLKDFNDVGAYYLATTKKTDKDGNIVYGFSQPDTPEAKMVLDRDKLLKYTKQIKNRFTEMIQMGNERLPSGYEPEKMLLSIEGYEKKYLLPGHEDEE